jgi:metallophosphoesterase (TIGR00282 family)
MGSLGVTTVSKLLPKIKSDQNIDVVVAQAENVTEGRGLSLKDFEHLKSIGIDFLTGGNWTLNLGEIYDVLNDPSQPAIRPANYPYGTPGLGWKYLQTDKGQILVISLLGKIVGKDADNPMDNPLITVDKILDSQKDVEKIGTVVNFHGDYSSEKVVIGHYLDGRVTAVVGDHWHVPTADARVLPNKTAHITDVGMCGALNASLGVKLPAIYRRWKNDMKTKNELETEGPCQFNGVIVDFDTSTGLANNIVQIQQYTEN